jgi:sterol 3beta-glucosyltransferase
MKILILTMGSRGDVQPYVALARGLQAAGHELTLATGELFAPMVQAYGLPFAPLDDEMIRLTETPAGKEIMQKGGSMKAIKLVQPMIARMLRDAWAVAQAYQPEVIVYHPKTLSGYHIGQKLGVPAILSMVLPMYTPTRAFPIPLTGKQLGGWLNWHSYKMVSLISAPYTKVINGFREELGLPAIGRFFNETKQPDGLLTPTLYGYSEHVLPRPWDWPESTHVSGYWFLPAEANWQPSAELAAFLADGPPPVYIGFGSMAGTEPEKLANTAVSALQQTNQRGIIATGWGGLKPANLPTTIFQLDQAPHDWLFPQMAAVIHHGGSGTTAAGLRAGKPTLICPFLADQPFWGAQVARLGAGPQPIPQKKLTVANLAQAITQMVTDGGMKARAEQVGQAIMGEDGLAEAARFIANYGRG